MKVLKKIALATVARRLRWIDDLSTISEGTPATAIGAMSALVPLGESDGAILYWTFDIDKNENASVAFLRLTEREAEAVYTADPFTTGMIEPIRSTLKHTTAVVGRQFPDGSIRGQLFIVPRDGSEEDFVASMFKLVEEPRLGLHEAVDIPRSVPLALSMA
ncbi:hypothetical protein WKY82_08975 [Gordonia malaquae]|uniref:hypothetical protein n=1 Tax=Gordonia malaquae TaxID=410332 RepID=UPI0030C7908B